MKTGQFYGQLFVYVLMLIVFSSILLFGFVAVQKLLDRADLIEVQNFKVKMNRLYESNIHYGTSEALTLNVPGNVEEICFIDDCWFQEDCDFGGFGPRLDERLWVDKYPHPSYSHLIIEDILSGFSPSNVYLYPDGEDNFEIGPLVVLHQEEIYDLIGNTLPGVTPEVIAPQSIYSSNYLGNNDLEHQSSAYQNFNCMEVIAGSIRIKFQGKGNKVQLTQLPLV